MIGPKYHLRFIVGQRVKVYLVRFVHEGEKVWMDSSFDFVMGNQVCKELALRGLKPALYKVVAKPTRLLSCGTSWRRVA